MDSTDLSLSGGVYRFDEFELDTRRRSLVRRGAPVTVSPKAFEVLTYLVENPGRVVSKEELLKAVWRDSYVEEGSLSQQVSQLRKAMGDGAGAIVTIPGRGYQFAAKVEVVAESVPRDEVARNGAQVLLPDGVLVRERATVLVEESSVARVVGRGRPRWVRWAIGLAVVAIGVGGWAGWRRLRMPGADELRQVVVAEFINGTSDQTFDRMLRRALEIDLDQSPYMDVLSEGEAVATLRMMGQKSDDAMTADIAREICVRTNRQVLLTGSIVSVGDVYLVTLEATDCNTRKSLAGAKAEASSKERVLGALDTVADRVRRQLGESKKSVASFEVPISQATTPSLEALKSYSIALYLTDQGKDWTETLPLYQRAVEQDPQFAMAWGAMANDYYNLSELRLASESYAKAFALSDRVSAKERLILQAHYYTEGQNDLVEGIKVYQSWAETYPHEWTPWLDEANAYNELGEYDRAIVAGRQALRLETKRGVIYTVLARAYMDSNRMEEAKAVGREAIANGQESQAVHSKLLLVAYAQHDAEAVTRETKWGEANNSGWYGWYFPYLQGEEAGAAGRYREAEEWFRRSVAVASRENLAETADDVLIDEATMEYQLGDAAAARATVGRIRKPNADDPDLALLRVHLGDVAAGERFVAAHGGSSGEGTKMTFVSVPLVKAALALERNRAADAIAALETTRVYEMTSFQVPTERGVAYMKLGQAEMAAGEYRRILTAMGPGLGSSLYPLAHLGLARAYAAEGKKAESAKEYEALFEGWKDADGDLPVLVETKVEYARVSGK
jgi:DNA-binding winged helix-turn-helix (wHTH) protein/tetratricopeptide (TPR) repeat protein